MKGATFAGVFKKLKIRDALNIRHFRPNVKLFSLPNIGLFGQTKYLITIRNNIK